MSALTLLIAGGVVLTSTSLGCGPAQKLGLKGVASHCKTSAVATVTPTPFPTISGLPNTPPASAPYNPPASAPYNPPASAPYNPPASGSYPPFVPPPSGAGSGVPTYTLSCRLPVFNGPPGSGGFIVYPGGSYIADPSSSVVLPSPSPGAASPPPPGYGPGYSGLSYDLAYHKWLPVPFSSVSPDGGHYAHVATTSIYVENVANGSTTELGAGHAWSLTDVENSGLYATINQQAGLWYLPYSGAAATEVTASGYWTSGSHGAAYGMAVSAVPQGIANTIIKVDLSTRAITDWFRREGAQSFVIGLDNQGHPVIVVNYFPTQYSNGASEVWVTAAPKIGAPIFGSVENVYSYNPPVADSHGIWFSLTYSVPYEGSVQGLALYVPGSGLYWMSSLGTQLAGGCN